MSAAHPRAGSLPVHGGAGAGPVLVGYDGSLEAWCALRHALTHLPPETPIVVVSALGRERAMPLPRLEGMDEVRARLEALYLEDTDAVDAELELVVEDGAPGPALVRLAEERGAQLVVVGHHRRGRLGILHASVAGHLLEHSPVPVLVVP